jgi:DNA modification methylase
MELSIVACIGQLYLFYYWGVIMEIRKADLIHDFGEWLNSFTWTLWATFTFKYECSYYSAMKTIDRFLKRNLYNYRAFAVFEKNNFRSGVHIHMLILAPEETRRLDLMDKWAAKYGWSRIYAYEKDKGAAWYMIKYILKDYGQVEFDFMGDWDIEDDGDNILFNVR